MATPRPPDSGDECGGSGHSTLRIFRHAQAIRQNDALLSSVALSSDDRARLLQLAGDAMEVWGRRWTAGEEERRRWASFLNKRHLKEEVEESLVALAPLIAWLEKADEAAKVTVVDVCCGKGICSILLSYLCGLAKASNFKPSVFELISKIVMLDKETIASVDWGHIREANKSAIVEGRPVIEIWEGCDLHATDAIYDRFAAIPTSLALVGIHLCRHLSPALVGLVNSLGPTKAKFLCLAPCCLPRQARRDGKKRKKSGGDGGIIRIPLYEAPAARRQRVEAMRLREHTLRRGRRGAACYLCQSPEHFVRECAQLPTNEEERRAILEAAAKEAPCWKCGQKGHSRRDCPLQSDADAPAKPRFVPPPTAPMDCEPASRAGTERFAVYCEILSKMVQHCESVQTVDAPLAKKNGHGGEEERDNLHWNSGRKSTFIVVER
ncbi:hypothetical protein ACHAXT_003761 [Thalassiosira profunda]